MKKTILLMGSLMLTIFLAACGGDANLNNENTSEDPVENTEQTNEEVVEKEGSDNNTDLNEEEANSAEDMQAKMDELDYKEIEIEVDYGENKEYEIEIEPNENETIEAKIEDEVNDEFLKGTDAFNKLYPMVKDLSIDKDTSKNDAINDVLNIFELDEDYSEFELEITFDDGDELEYEDE